MYSLVKYVYIHTYVSSRIIYQEKKIAKKSVRVSSKTRQVSLQFVDFDVGGLHASKQVTK